jgi:hypothetical protein
MAELFAIWLACKNVGAIARERGVRARPYQVRTVVLWFVFEFIAMFVAILLGLRGPLMYGAALCGALLSLHFSFSAARRGSVRGTTSRPPSQRKP